MPITRTCCAKRRPCLPNAMGSSTPRFRSNLMSAWMRIAQAREHAGSNELVLQLKRRLRLLEGFPHSSLEVALHLLHLFARQLARREIRLTNCHTHATERNGN